MQRDHCWVFLFMRMAMNDSVDYISDLKMICDSISIESQEQVNFLGRGFALREYWPYLSKDRSIASARSPIEALLIHLLYQYAYTQKLPHKFSDSLDDLSEKKSESIDQSFVKALSEANTSQQSWDDGWLVLQVSAKGEVIAIKNGFRRSVLPGEYVSLEGIGIKPHEGTPIRLFFEKELIDLQIGYYFAFSNACDRRFSVENVLRFYFNITAKVAPILLKKLTSRLNRFQVPFRVKCLKNPDTYDFRIDSMILYVNRFYYRLVSEILSDIHKENREYFLPDVPLFTKKIRPGFAYAEDPNNGESFGMSRCRIVAEGIWDAYRQSYGDSETVFQFVKRRFHQYGLVLDKPYLSQISNL